MNEKWFDESSVVAYPHEIKFLNIDGGSMSYCVDRHVSEYVGKIQAQLNTLQNENRDKDIKNMILQSKIDKAIEYINSQKKTISKWQADLFNEDRDNESKLKVGTFMWNVDELLDILKEDK